jgi:hypothetical protein
MYRVFFLVSFIMFWDACVPTSKVTKDANIPVDTIIATEVATPVETVYVTTIETVVETVNIATGVTPESEVSVKEESSAEEIAYNVGRYRVQIGAFREEGNASALYNSLKSEYGELICMENISPYWKVYIGNYSGYKDALSARDNLRDKGFNDSWVSTCK